MTTLLTYSEPGENAINEDYLVTQIHVIDKNYLICALADGQGGTAGGAQAAKTACEAVINMAQEKRPKDLLEMETWFDIFYEADKSVTSDKVAGLTTLVAFCLNSSQISGASTGDSELYLIDTKGTKNLTSAQIKNPPLGTSGSLAIPFSARLSVPWKVLTMTDGVWKYGGIEKIYEIGTDVNSQSIIDMLLQKARLPRSGKLQDDFSIIVVDSE